MIGVVRVSRYIHLLLTMVSVIEIVKTGDVCFGFSWSDITWQNMVVPQAYMRVRGGKLGAFIEFSSIEVVASL